MACLNISIIKVLMLIVLERCRVDRFGLRSANSWRVWIHAVVLTLFGGPGGLYLRTVLVVLNFLTHKAITVLTGAVKRLLSSKLNSRRNLRLVSLNDLNKIYVSTQNAFCSAVHMVA